MLKKRIIPILTFNGFGLVKTKSFANPRMVGNPVQAARVYNARGVDELVFVDIAASTQQRKLNYKLVADIMQECYMPTAIGGAVSTLEDIHQLLSIGADKVVIKTVALAQPEFVERAARQFGSQAIVVALDAQAMNGAYRLYAPHVPQLHLQATLTDALRQFTERGAGEFIVTSVAHDGQMQGYDLDLYRLAVSHTQRPVVASGGAGNPGHFVDLHSAANVSGFAAASMYHFTQYTPLDAKRALQSAGAPVRIPTKDDAQAA